MALEKNVEVQIGKVEEKRKDTGEVYLSLHLSSGQFTTCWDEALFAQLREAFQKQATVELKLTGSKKLKPNSADPAYWYVGELVRWIESDGRARGKPEGGVAATAERPAANGNGHATTAQPTAGPFAAPAPAALATGGMPSRQAALLAAAAVNWRGVGPLDEGAFWNLVMNMDRYLQDGNLPRQRVGA